jgi:hypothetical protein
MTPNKTHEGRVRKRKQHELVVFLAMWAVDYAKAHKLNGLHPKHYDLMVKYGARMVDFKRATKTGTTT